VLATVYGDLSDCFAAKQDVQADPPDDGRVQLAQVMYIEAAACAFSSRRRSINAGFAPPDNAVDSRR